MQKLKDKGGDGELPLNIKREVYGTSSGTYESTFIHYEMNMILVGGALVLMHMSLLVTIIIISAFFVCFMLYWEVRGRQLAAQRIS